MMTLVGLPYFSRILRALSPSLTPAKEVSFVLTLLNTLPAVTSDPFRMLAGTFLEAGAAFFPAQRPGTAAAAMRMAISTHKAAFAFDVI
ncbi:MAG: hypothetical protein IK083_05385 [Abditibacteriota bacterium]|nr:hypothetical protein [Abditibacteriota bacterium]